MSDMDWGVIIAAIILTVPPTVLSWLARNKSSETHVLVNSRMTELLEINRKQAADEATLIEKAEHNGHVIHAIAKAQKRPKRKAKARKR